MSFPSMVQLLSSMRLFEPIHITIIVSYITMFVKTKVYIQFIPPENEQDHLSMIVIYIQKLHSTTFMKWTVHPRHQKDKSRGITIRAQIILIHPWRRHINLPQYETSFVVTFMIQPYPRLLWLSYKMVGCPKFWKFEERCPK